MPLHRADRVPGDQEGGLRRPRCCADHDLSRFRTLFLAGERLDPDTYEWASAALGMPVIDNWWQTETGWPIAANLEGIEPLPIKPGSPTVPVPGYDVQVLDARGRAGPSRAPRARSASGCRCRRARCRRCGATTTATSASYLAAYPGYYLTGDGGYVDEDGYLFVMGRTDDVINVAGHRLSTGSLEAALAGHPAVAECAVIGVHDDLKGQVPRGLVVLKAGVDADATESGSRAELVAAGARRRSARSPRCSRSTSSPALPKTRSGKILRKTMREIADGKTPGRAGDDRGRRRSSTPSAPSSAGALTVEVPATGWARDHTRSVAPSDPARMGLAITHRVGVVGGEGRGRTSSIESTRWTASRHRAAGGHRVSAGHTGTALGPVLPPDEHERRQRRAPRGA